MGRMHSDAQLTLFSSFSLGKISKFLLRSLVRRFAGSSSVKYLFLLCARQNKQVSFALAYASVPAHVEMMGFLGIGQVMCKWVNGSSLTFTTNAAITRQRQQTPMVGAAKRQGCATQLRYRSGYRWRIEQVNLIDLEQIRELSFLGWLSFLLPCSMIPTYKHQRHYLNRNTF